MQLLSKLSPAETMLLIESSSSSLKDLMKFTFMDLLLKKVIEIKEEKRRPNPRDKYVRKYTYIIKGKNLPKYSPKAHELIFIKSFIKSPSIKILFKHFIKMGYEEAKGVNSFKKSIISSNIMNQYAKQSFFQRIFGGFTLSNDGQKVKSEVLAYLKPIDDNIGNIINRDKVKALDILVTLGGNIFLLNNLDFKLLKKIDSQLIKEQKLIYSESYAYGDDWWYYFDFYEDSYMFDSYFDNFDHTVDSFDSDFDSAGCSSCDSGCSSCSGCGGCD